MKQKIYFKSYEMSESPNIKWVHSVRNVKPLTVQLFGGIYISFWWSCSNNI